MLERRRIVPLPDRPAFSPSPIDSRSTSPTLTRPRTPEPTMVPATSSITFRALIAIVCCAALYLFLYQINLSGIDSNEVSQSSILKVELNASEGEELDMSKCSSDFESPHPLRTQRCCHSRQGAIEDGEGDDHEGLVRCLPQLVVVGAQKAGTTALHSYLMLHPQIRVGRKKEMHLFDFDRNFEKLAQRVVDWIPPFSASDTGANIIIDSSPSYLADRDACPRMARSLSINARFVLLLRNPVERLWSDIKMKHRRIQAQSEFLYQLVPMFHAEVRKCIVGGAIRSINHFRTCLPRDLARHGRIVSFYKFIATAPNTTLTLMTETCLKSDQDALSCMQGPLRGRIMNETMPRLPHALLNEMVRLKRLMRDCCRDEMDTLSLTESKVGCGSICFPKTGMMSDISKNFLWRSLYLPQLLHCAASIDLKRRFLVVDFAQLRRDPVQVVQRALEHVGLDPSLISPSNLREDIAQQAFRRQYPDFESVSGWAKVSNGSQGLDDLPEDVTRTLEDFFRPYNRQLFRYLNISPLEGWSV